ISPYTGDPTVAVVFPMTPGYLVGNIRLRRLSYIGTQISSSGKIELVITSSQGSLLVHPNRSLILQQENILNSAVVRKILNGETGTLETEFGGRQVLCSTSLIKPTNWAVLVMQSKQSAFALLRGVIISLVVLMLLSGGLSVALAYFSRRRIVKPIVQLMDTIREIAEGNYSPSEPVSDNYREIQYVSTNMLHMAKQIAEREIQLKRNLHEKEVLVKEVHHRVKNNLQLVLSILNLKYTSIKDEAVKNALYDNIGRIYTISQVHEQLYSSDSLAEIDLSTYLPSLLTYLLTLEKYISYQVLTDVQVEKVLLNIDQAIPVGLIMFELISNSLQHSFSHDSSGRIRLVCQRDAENIRINIGDNGNSFDPKLFQEADSVGFSIIHELIRQLRGSILYENVEGNLFKIVIPTAGVL
ncbi:MAG: histidine kinase dimerization/phosphoacceptor domain -containing protein, partial [Spirochaetota bacterium]